MIQVLLVFSMVPLSASTETTTSKSKGLRQPEMDTAAAALYGRQFYEKETDKNQPSSEPTPQMLWEGIERNAWPDSLNNFRGKFQPGRSYLTLYKKFPRNALDMRSPNRFKNTMSANEIYSKSNSIGHMSIGWSCVSSSTAERTEGFAAQTGETGQSEDMMDSDWGVTGLIATFTDGEIQNAERVQEYFSTDFVDMVEDGRTPNVFSALVLEVPTQECEAVRAFVKSYVLHPGKPYRRFGLLPDPLKFEGAGCGSFAVAALAHSATFAPILETYWRTIPIAGKLLGRRTKVFLPNDTEPPLFAKTAAEEYPVSRTDLFLMNWDSGKIAMKFRMVDPELTIYSMRRFEQLAISENPNSVTRYQKRQHERLQRTLNLGGGGGDGYPANDHDHGFQEIDSGFDPSFATVQHTVDHWWQARRGGSNLELVSFPFGTGVLIQSKP